MLAEKGLQWCRVEFVRRAYAHVCSFSYRKAFQVIWNIGKTQSQRVHYKMTSGFQDGLNDIDALLQLTSSYSFFVDHLIENNTSSN